MSKAATLLFAHGGGFCKETWEPIVRRLRASSLLEAVNTQVVLFDFKYHGSNRDESVAPRIDLDNPRGPRVHHPASDLTRWTSAEMLKQARALRSKSFDAPLIGIGHSMGASAMWNIEAQYPGTFDGLILFEPVYGELNSDVVTNFLVSITLQRESSWPSRAWAEEHLRNFKNFAAWDRESLEAYMKGGLVEDTATGKTVLACSTPIEASLYCHKLLHLSDQQLALPKCKIFFHYGSRTKMFLAPVFKKLGDKWPHIYTLEEPIPNSSHAMVLEKPAESAQNILDNLLELEPFREEIDSDVASASRFQDVASGDQQRFLGEATSWLSLLNHSTSSHESSSVESGSDDVASVTTKCPNNTRQQKARKGPAKRRRTTYDIRKQQKNDLLTEIAKLEKQLNLLKDRALLEQGGESTTIQRTEIANAVLRECSQEQHVMIAGMQARLVAHMVHISLD
ncbi:unnamed protein product [Phytophthora lilii]|uniref:Unnamed protein product n=1 Tax=Phytophthora lilii TaxID=2077276 RepID=A0A9W6TKP4_9STRA|nr:unnamed protein product [Phytophthora lilii]